VLLFQKNIFKLILYLLSLCFIDYRKLLITKNIKSTLNLHIYDLEFFIFEKGEKEDSHLEFVCHYRFLIYLFLYQIDVDFSNLNWQKPMSILDFWAVCLYTQKKRQEKFTLIPFFDCIHKMIRQTFRIR
jgi:hypothetical protein